MGGSRADFFLADRWARRMARAPPSKGEGRATWDEASSDEASYSGMSPAFVGANPQAPK